MAHSNDEIRGILVQSGNERLLLPNATVAEVLSRAPVEPIAGAPDWLPGRINWQGWQVPLVAFAHLTGQGRDAVAHNSKIVVLKTLSGNESMPYFALLTPSFPRLVSVPRDGLLADATEEDLPPGVQMRVLLGEEGALLPDLESVEIMIGDALAKAA
ncbi:chemotaxis protein CheW [Pseudoxanthomonas wuyuanensis]|uniref:Chemosensory pili system protein ChpC n=1 Tax=Pseudoxanthomonas wuyuanensis TaxID=1073196 RepID=A0A286D7X0_9GAMM|nr:chemotaxis protein CheW [Pseudoxanthomonas wuyuanensis]KAF1720358.1 chemotaxis protein CheW [Pseudoxanthomonas wuyuanensis]SOD54717.1 chemosensory pili system protein ChpC [Pseudoxanthomonas wuyuanensis]